MFNKLLNLFKKNSLKTPLEDFTTELFVGVLNNDKNLKLKFCKDFLGLKSERFIISSQQHYFLEDYPNCIVDVVIKGENEICFIENKVNSKEGIQQLDRYSKVLDNCDNEKTKLVYCTKNSDLKKRKTHSFFQCKWRDIAEFFRQHSSESMTNLFIKYLKENDMSNDMTINAKDIVTLENISKILNLMNKNLENVEHIFKRKFGNLDKDTLKKELFKNERFCIRSKPACEGEGYSEVLYGFGFQGYIFAQIFIANTNKNYDAFLKIINNQKDFKVDHHDNIGSRIFLDKSLGDFLNNDNSQVEIQKWFVDSFDNFETFMEATKKEIGWNKYVALQKT